MSDPVYQSFIDLAIELIGQYGRNFTLRTFSFSGEKYNPTKTPSDSTIKGVFVKIDFMKIDGNLIKKGDKMLLVDSNSTVLVSDEIIDDGRTYKIANVQMIKPGSSNILSKIHVRG